MQFVLGLVAAGHVVEGDARVASATTRALLRPEAHHRLSGVAEPAGQEDPQPPSRPAAAARRTGTGPRGSIGRTNTARDVVSTPQPVSDRRLGRRRWCGRRTACSGGVVSAVGGGGAAAGGGDFAGRCGLPRFRFGLALRGLRFRRPGGHAAHDLALVDLGLGDFALGQILFELAVGDRLPRHIRQNVLPDPEHDQEEDNIPPREIGQRRTLCTVFSPRRFVRLLGQFRKTGHRQHSKQ